MIELYAWRTPNGFKVPILLEETRLPWRFHPVHIGRAEQFGPEFLALSPNNKTPAMLDDEPPGGGAPLSLFESGAILLYLAEKSGQLIPSDVHGRGQVLEWLFWQVGGLGPMAGQIEHFNVYATENVPYAIERYTKETARLFGVLDKRLGDREFIAGAYSIADIACYPWILPYPTLGQDLARFPSLQRWFGTMAARPAVVRAYELVGSACEAWARS